MSRRKPAPSKPSRPAFPLVVETFMDPMYEIGRLRGGEPSAFNGWVRIRRYRVTAEIIDEPIEVLRDRLRTLWLTSERNYHARSSMRATASEIGMAVGELIDDDQGSQHGKAP